MASIVGNLYIKSADWSQNIYQNSSFTFDGTTLGTTLATYAPWVIAVSNSIWWTAIDNSLQMGAVVTSYGAGDNLTLYDATPAEKVIGFYLDWTEYKIWWDEAAWWNISWTLSDQTDLQNALNSKQNTLTAWENIKISSNVISANNVFIITEDDVTVSTDDTKWVAPYNTSYGYTNIDISASAGIEWREWAIYTFVVDTEMVVASAYRNVRVKIWTWTYIPVMWTTASLSWSSYFTKTNIRQFQYSTKYEAGWALHLFTDSNTTYTAMTEAKAKAWTETTARTITAAVLKTAIKYHAVDDTAYASSWDGVTDTAPSKNAVYDKIQSVVSSIPTVNNATLTIQKNWTNVQTFTANQSTNATANITVPTDTSDLTNWAWFITGITSWDVTTALWYTPQSALTTQTAYTSKWTATKVPQITTNSLGQVTGITEVTIDHPSVGNGTFTVKQGWTSKATFSANQSSNWEVDLNTSFLKTQAEYDALPSSKNTDGNFYFIYNT